MPIFKGFEKDHHGTVMAVVDFPNAKRHQPYLARDENGQQTMYLNTTPFPHEERLDENAFQQKFGLDFATVKALPFNENGHDLRPILQERLHSAMQQVSVGFKGPSEP